MENPKNCKSSAIQEEMGPVNKAGEISTSTIGSTYESEKTVKTKTRGPHRIKEELKIRYRPLPAPLLLPSIMRTAAHPLTRLGTLRPVS
jgi:hypothetical protein